MEDLFIKLKTKEICWLLLLQLMTTTTENEFAFNLPTITGKHFNQLNWDIDWGTSLYPIAGNRVNCYTNFLGRPSAPFRFVLRYRVMLMQLVIMLEVSKSQQGLELMPVGIKNSRNVSIDLVWSYEV